MQGQCWWITGASSGIGAALARALARRGAKLVLSGRNVAALDAVAKDCGAGTMILPFEATDYAAIPLMVEEAWRWCGRVVWLVNKAGISQRSLAVETEFSVYETIVAVDLLAPIALTQALLPRMIDAGGGQIVAISSIAGIAGVPLRSAYCAAKHGLIGYHDSVRAENEHLGLKVLVVAPGSIATNVSRNALNADGSVRGTSDKAIDNGLSPDFAASEILAAVDAGRRELVVAEGAEAAIPPLRRSDPDALFDRMSAMVQAGYAAQMKAGREG